MVNDINGGKISLYGITPINNPYATSRHFFWSSIKNIWQKNKKHQPSQLKCEHATVVTRARQAIGGGASSRCVK